MNFTISRITISRMSNKVGKQRQLDLLNNQKPKFHRRRHVATPNIVRRIASYIRKENPPTIRVMVARCNTSFGTVISVIRDVIRAKCLKKKPVHQLNPGVIEKRRSRAWRMYLRLCNDKYKIDVTTDEA